MKIVVCVKEVPDTNEVKINTNFNTIIRNGVESVINAFDYHAIEEGVRLKEKYSGYVTAISMGPLQCSKALREALSFGCDKAILLSCREFAGADTLATSYTLSSAIKKLEDVDVVLLGKQTSDGNTGQVGPQLAELLNITHITNVTKIVKIEETKSIIVEKQVEDGTVVLRCSLPVLITVAKDINKPRFPTLKGRIRAKRMEICVWDTESFNLEKCRIGLDGSPTKVERIFSPDYVKKDLKMFTGSAEESINGLICELERLKK